MIEFALILMAGLGSAVLGAGFGWAVGAWAPELINLLFGTFKAVDSPRTVAAAMGAISGLVIGAVAMAVGLLTSAIRSRKPPAY